MSVREDLKTMFMQHEIFDDYCEDDRTFDVEKLMCEIERYIVRRKTLDVLSEQAKKGAWL